MWQNHLTSPFHAGGYGAGDRGQLFPGKALDPGVLASTSAFPERLQNASSEQRVKEGFAAAFLLPRTVLANLNSSCYLKGKNLLLSCPELPCKAAVSSPFLGRGGCDLVPEKAFVCLFTMSQHTSRWRLVDRWKVAERWKLTSSIKYCAWQLRFLVVERESDRKISCLLFSTVLLSPKQYRITSTGVGLIMYAYQSISLRLPVSTLMQQKQFPHHWAHLI